MISRTAFRRLSLFTDPPSYHLCRHACLFNRTAHSLSSSAAAAGDESAVYRDSRRYARPSIVAWTPRLHNSVSFIGTVEFPFKQFATRNGNFGVYTTLLVKTCPDSHISFRVLVEIWDDMAERAFQHLKPNDYIYVSGQLGSYTKTALQGIEKIKYKVRAKELNYVKQGEQEERLQRIVKSEPKRGRPSLEKHSRLHLWQIFFANPNEWYDQRKTKKTPMQPDFKHKSSGEALWLTAEDPPWIKKQLEKLSESRLSGGPPKDVACKSFSTWVV